MAWGTWYPTGYANFDRLRQVVSFYPANVFSWEGWQAADDLAGWFQFGDGTWTFSIVAGDELIGVRGFTDLAVIVPDRLGPTISYRM